MNELTVFNFKDYEVREITDENNNPWFVAKDVVLVLGYKDTVNAIKQHCNGVVKYHLRSGGQIREMSIIPESDVYRLIIRSKLPEAEKFEKWIVEEVLPSIRKNGGYLSSAVDFTDPDNIQRLLDAWKEDRKRLEEQKPAVEFYNAVTDSKDAIPMSQVAKVLDIGMGRNKLFELLRAKSILRQNNEPYQTFIDRGYFRVIEQKYTTPEGETRISIKTLVYQRGLDYIRKIANEDVSITNAEIE